MSTQLKSILLVAVPVVLIGLLAWKLKDDDETSASEKSTPEAKADDAGVNVADESPVAVAAENVSVVSATIPEPPPPKPRIEIKSSPGRGRGLFMVDRQGQTSVAAGQVVALVRPALTLLFEPFCYTHCFGCYADLHEVSPVNLIEDSNTRKLSFHENSTLMEFLYNTIPSSFAISLKLGARQALWRL